eukprot:XP_025010059.1 uncharacterized protein LOC107054283 [Gallus gallus]
MPAAVMPEPAEEKPLCQHWTFPPEQILWWDEEDVQSKLLPCKPTGEEARTCQLFPGGNKSPAELSLRALPTGHGISEVCKPTAKPGNTQPIPAASGTAEEKEGRERDAFGSFRAPAGCRRSYSRTLRSVPPHASPQRCPLLSQFKHFLHRSQQVPARPDPPPAAP